jgi:hypothetical protein
VLHAPRTTIANLIENLADRRTLRWVRPSESLRISKNVTTDTTTTLEIVDGTLEAEDPGKNVRFGGE